MGNTKQKVFGNQCVTCSEILTPENSCFKNGYLQSRCKSCQKEHSNSVPSRSKKARSESYANWKFGISPEKYNKKLELQLNGCAICKQPCDVRSRLAIDHNHRTNIIRDLLCHKCNVALGLVNENEDILINMIEYLKRHNSRVA